MDPKKTKQKVLQAQLDDTQKRELDLSRRLNDLPAESRRDFVLRELESHPVTRAMSVDAANFDDETQSFDFTFSSEFPVQRWFGLEILIHDNESADLRRMNDGGAFCIDHDAYEGHIGTHEKAWIDLNEKVGRGRARLSKNNPRAVREYLDIKDAIRLHISTRYRVLDLVIHQFEDKPDEYHITRWEVLENSTVAIAADPTVAIGRELDNLEIPAQEPEKESSRMDPKDTKKENTPDVEVIRNEARTEGMTAGREAGERSAQEKMSRMLDVGAKFGQLEMAREFIAAGKNQDELVDACLEARSTNPTPSDTDVGLSDKEAARFRFTKLIRAEADPGNRAAKDDAGFEYEVVSATRAATGSGQNGLPISMEVMRSQLISDGPTGGLLSSHGVGTSMVEELVNSMKFLQLGAQPFGELIGTFDIPVDEGGFEAHVLGEDEAPDSSEGKFGLLGMSAKTIGASGYYPRSWTKQVSMDIEIFMRRKLMQAHGLKQDYLIAMGLGGRHQPVGLFNTPGVPIVVGDTNGAAVTRDHLIKLQTLPDVANALMGNLAFLTNSLVKGKLMRTPEHPTANVGGWTWARGNGTDPTVGDLVGYPAHVSNSIPSDLDKGSALGICSALVFGDFSQIAIGSWGPIEITVDPYSSSNKGGTWVHTFSDFDSLVMRPKSFALMKDALTD